MFGLTRRRAETKPDPKASIALMREVSAQVRARRHDVREVAIAVLAMVRFEALDLYYTTSEIDDWIREWARIGGIDVTDLDFGIVRQQIKAQEGVKFYETRIKRDPSYRTIRTRLLRKLGRIPEKQWVYYVASSEMAAAPTVERVSGAKSGSDPPPDRPRLVAAAPTDGHRSRRQASGHASGDGDGAGGESPRTDQRSRSRTAA